VKFAALGSAIVAGVGCLAGSAGAQTIYRCANAYTRIPCPNGHPLESIDPRTAAQRAQARRLVADEKRQTADTSRERRRDEAALQPALASSLGPVAALAVAASAPKNAVRKKRHRKVQLDDERDFVAEVSGSGKGKSARR
jgi:hypothetical protein